LRLSARTNISPIPSEPPLSDCGMRVKEPSLLSFVQPRRRHSSAPTTFRNGRRAQGMSRLAALRGHRRLGLYMTEHDGKLAVLGRKGASIGSGSANWLCQAPAGSPFSPWSRGVPATAWHSTIASPNVARVLTIKNEGMQAAPRVSCSLVPAGTRTLSGRSYLRRFSVTLRRRLRPNLQNGTVLLKATCDA
jgi:hypothetical protein